MFQDGSAHGRCICPRRRVIWAVKSPTWPSKAQVAQFLRLQGSAHRPLEGVSMAGSGSVPLVFGGRI